MMNRREAVGSLLLGGLALATIGQAEAACPNIDAAIKALTAAKSDLQNAAHDYNGHRADALKAVNAALSQLGLCLQSKQCS